MTSELDHLIVGVSDLLRGIQFVEHAIGVRPAVGGVHPGRGTRNALLSLGPQSYLEVLAPDPQQNSLAWFHMLPQLTEPRLVGWMVHPSNYPPVNAPQSRTHALESLAQRLRTAGIKCGKPSEYSRLRADGRTLRWKLLPLEESGRDAALRRGVPCPATVEALLPIIIQWDADSPHPALNAPSGCALLKLEVCSPKCDELQHVFEVLGLDLQVSAAKHPRLGASVAGPRGMLDLSS